MRIDKLLWFLRWVKTRSLAQNLVSEAHIRLNGRRVERCAQGVAKGDILVLPWGSGVRVIEIISLPQRRGAASEAQSAYRVLDERCAYTVAAAPTEPASERNLQP
jgi:ribosome-associated heat shock protein Hsp15